MKEVKLLSMTLKNFKGVKDFTLQANGEDLKIYGDNGTGKTTIFDAFVWLLFDKDSQNKKEFSIKTLKGGEELHNLEHSVEASFEISGKPLTLRKIYKEKWTKRRGAPVAEFTGHTTEYAIDSVPAKKKEFQDAVDTIVQEDVFRLLTTPTYFNEQLKWQDRRKALLEVCGDIQDADVIRGNDELKELPEILGGRSIDDHRKVVSSKRSEIKKELDKIPVRIDEIHRSLPAEEVDVAKIEKQAADIDKTIEDNKALISNIKNGAVITDRKQKLRAVEMDLEDIKRRLESETIEKANKLSARIQEEQGNISITERKIGDLEHAIERNWADAKELGQEIESLRTDWKAENEKKFVHKADCECPTCGQSLPEEQLEDAKRKALEAFNETKALTLKSINELGKSKAEKRSSLLQEAESMTKEVDVLKGQAEQKRDLVARYEAEIAALRESVKDARKDPAYQEKLQERSALEGSIEELQVNAEQAAADLEKEIANLKAQRDVLSGQLAQAHQVKAAKKRIAELEKEQRDLAIQYEKLEREQYLTDEFVRVKVNLLEEKINSKFKHARFKLFETQVNGGLQEVCETTYDGVPYSSGLNNAARINVGIDIINTLTEHYGIRAPIFVDNAEAVTEIAETDSQLISLIVSEADKQLRVEPGNQTIKEAI